MLPLSFPDARSTVLREVKARAIRPAVESVGLGEAQFRILAGDIPADRDYPPFDRSARDGFAVRSDDLPGTLRVVGEVRAGETFTGAMHRGEAVEIMTGAPVPAGADAVVMVEHCTRDSDGAVRTERAVSRGDNITPRGSEAKAGAVLLERGSRIDYSAVALPARDRPRSREVFERPRVAILATGDEIVDVAANPAPHQIRNSNAWSLAAQVERAGAIPRDAAGGAGHQRRDAASPSNRRLRKRTCCCFPAVFRREVRCGRTGAGAPRR